MHDRLVEGDSDSSRSLHTRDRIRAVLYTQSLSQTATAHNAATGYDGYPPLPWVYYNGCERPLSHSD